MSVLFSVVTKVALPPLSHFSPQTVSLRIMSQQSNQTKMKFNIIRVEIVTLDESHDIYKNGL